MTRSKSITALCMGLLLVGVSACGTAVKPGQAGLRYSGWGEGLHSDPKNEGFYFTWPWNDVYVYDVTWASKTEEIRTLTADALHVPLRATVTFRPKLAELHRLATELGPNYYKDVIEPPFLTLTRAELAHYAHNDLAAKSPFIEQAITEKLKAALHGKPIEIDRVSISHIEYDSRVTQAISEKRAAVERVEQKASELKIAAQDAEIARTQAHGWSDATRIRAEGEAAAIVAKGEAQAKAQNEIGKTLTASYLKYKAFDNDSTRYYFVPIGKDGLPIIVGTDSMPAPRRPLPAVTDAPTDYPQH